MNKAHEIDYKILGEELQCVEIELDPQETVLAEPGSLMYLTDDIEMHTIFGDGTNQNAGFLGKLFTAGRTNFWLSFSYFLFCRRCSTCTFKLWTTKTNN